MDEDILSELDRQLENISLEKYWVRTVGGVELWLSSIDYTQSNKVKKVMETEFGLEEAKRVTISASIIGINGTDLRPLRTAGKTLKVAGKDGKKEFVDLSEYIYRRVASWDVEFVEVVFDVYADLMESHKKDLSKDIVFENAKTPEAELEALEERAAALRERLGKPPLIEAVRLDAETSEEEAVSEEQHEGSDEEETLPDAQPSAGPEDVTFQGAEEDFDPFEAVKNMSQRVQARPDPVPSAIVPAPSAPPPVPVPVPGSRPSAIEEAMARRKGVSSAAAPPIIRPHAAQPSVPSEVLEKGAARVTVDPPGLNPNPGSQSKNPRFRNAGGPR